MIAAAKHTAGPWLVEKPNQRQSPNLWITAPSSAGICKIEPCDYDDGKGERLTAEDYANARLIAAAPELLAFAKWVADRGGDNNCMDIFKRARSVIAKAEGGAS